MSLKAKREAKYTAIGNCAGPMARKFTFQTKRTALAESGTKMQQLWAPGVMTLKVRPPPITVEEVASELVTRTREGQVFLRVKKGSKWHILDEGLIDEGWCPSCRWKKKLPRPLDPAELDVVTASQFDADNMEAVCKDCVAKTRMPDPPA